MEFITEARAKGAEVHEVTQLVISLLGLIIFPWEAGAARRIEALLLEDLECQGWPSWSIELDCGGGTSTLGTLLKHLRNAAAHQRIEFSSDSATMAEVRITFRDALGRAAAINWQATIDAHDLKRFCDLFAGKLEMFVG